jgi:hypothetical protein
MKTLKAALFAGLALASSLAAQAESSAKAWLETYYQNPRPEQLSSAVHQLSRDGFFEQEGNVPLTIGFLSTVFAQNPGRVRSWVDDLSDLPLGHQRLVASAVWQAGNPLGSNLLAELSETSSIRQQILRLSVTPSVAIEQTPVLSPQSMNLQWGAFLASGSEKNVVAILQGMGGDRPALDAAARVAIAQNAATHPRVMEICRTQLDKQPEAVRAEVRAALQQASAVRKPGV